MAAMRSFTRLLAAALLALACIVEPALAAEQTAEGGILWSVRGRHNTVYLLGSVHFLNPSEPLPAAVDRAYADADALVMELDMDDLDPFEAQKVTLELGTLPPGESLQELLDPAAYELVATKAREAGLQPATLNRFQPWLAGLTLVQLHLMRMGLDPNSGVEQRLAARAVNDGKEVRGLEDVRDQLGLLAALPLERQREFLIYSVEDSERTVQEVDDLLGAWRRGDAERLAEILEEGFEQYPDLYRPLTVERNRRWLADIEALLGERRNYLVVVGALHLVGEESVVDLLERRGYRVVRR